MAKKRSNASRTILFATLALALFAAAAAGAFYFTKTYQGAIKLPGSGSSVHQRPTVNIEPAPQELVIYVPRETSNGSYLVPETVTSRSKDGRLDAALRILLTAGETGGMAEGLIPDGTKLLAPVRVSDGVAEVNLSSQFVDNFNGGLEQEALTINSIVQTLVSNSDGEVRRAQILVEGEKADSLGGHFELSEPVEPDPAVLKPNRKE